MDFQKFFWKIVFGHLFLSNFKNPNTFTENNVQKSTLDHNAINSKN